MTVVLGKWDRGLDFLQARVTLENLIRSQSSYLTSILPSTNNKMGMEFIYYSIAYVQLLNGARITEAIEALKYYVDTGQITFKLEAKKTKVLRPFKIPPLIQVNKVLYNIYKPIILKANKKIVVAFLKNRLGWNSHSLRYAFIRYAIEKGYTAEQLAIILGHKKLDTTLGYARNIGAEKILDDMQG